MRRLTIPVALACLGIVAAPALADAQSFLISDAYAGIPNQASGNDDYGVLLRFQWQLAL